MQKAHDDIEFYMLPAVVEQDLQGHRVAHIGVMGHYVGAEYVVAGVYDGGSAEKAGLRSGDRLVAADGKPFLTAGSFREKEDTQVRIEFKREGKSGLQSVLVTPVKQNVLRAFLDATARSARVLNVGTRKIGYVHLWTMGNEAFKTTLEQLVLGKLHDTDGLILDLRDGYGGNPFGYSDVFYRPDIVWEQQVHGAKAAAHNTGYDKPLVVLINGGTRSAKEFFTYQLKSTHRAVVLGSRTAGAFLGAGKFDIGSDGMLELAVLGLRVDGQRIEENGVVPDIEVGASQAYTANDVQLLRAEQTLTEIISRKATGKPVQGLTR